MTHVYNLLVYVLLCVCIRMPFAIACLGFGLVPRGDIFQRTRPAGPWLSPASAEKVLAAYTPLYTRCYQVCYILCDENALCIF
jgi:hypothetical protein